MTGTRSPPRPADRLDQQLVRALRGTLVRQVEGDVRGHDADERHGRDVQALGHEARPHQDVEAAVRERVDDALRGPAVLDDVAVEPADAEGRQRVADLSLEPLRAAAEVADPRVRRRPGSAWRPASPARSGGSAGWSRPGGRRAGDRSPGRPGRGRSPGRARPMPFPRRLSTRIAWSPPAASRPASAAINDLRQQAALPGGELLAQVDDLHGRRPSDRPDVEHDAVVFARLGAPDAVDGRRGRAEHDGRPGELAEPDRRNRGPAGAGSDRSCRRRRAPRRRSPGPTSASGAATARRVPTTMSTSPDRIRRHSSARSPSPRPEWSRAIRTSRSARSRSTSGSARAISGTSTRAGRPASRAAAIPST